MGKHGADRKGNLQKRKDGPLGGTVHRQPTPGDRGYIDNYIKINIRKISLGQARLFRATEVPQEAAKQRPSESGQEQKPAMPRRSETSTRLLSQL